MDDYYSPDQYRRELYDIVKTMRLELEKNNNSKLALHVIMDFVNRWGHTYKLGNFAASELVSSNDALIKHINSILVFIHVNFRRVDYDLPTEKLTGELIECIYNTELIDSFKEKLFHIRAAYVNLRPYFPIPKPPSSTLNSFGTPSKHYPYNPGKKGI